MSSEHLQPLESCSKKEWRDCAVYYEQLTYDHARKLVKLQEQLDEAHEVIEFYGDNNNFELEFNYEGSLVEVDISELGKTARKYLEKHKVKS